jgi:hypothetical protein
MTALFSPMKFLNFFAVYSTFEGVEAHANLGCEIGYNPVFEEAGNYEEDLVSYAWIISHADASVTKCSQD